MKKLNPGYVYVVFCALIFSAVEVVLKFTKGMFHPMQITVLRFLIGGAVLLPFALRAMKARRAVFTRADARFFAALGMFFVCVAMSFYQLAVEYAPASVVAVLFSCNPIFITVLAGLLLHEPIRKNHVLALCLEAVAVLLIVDPLHARLDARGVAFSLSSAALFALYSVLGKKRAARFGGIAVTSLCSLFGGAELLLLLLVGHTASGAAFFTRLGLSLYADVPLVSNLTAASLPWLLYLGAVNTGLGFVLHMLAMEKTDAQTASLVFFLKPMLAPLFALIFLREDIRLNMWLGIACFLVGSGCAILPGVVEANKQKKQEATIPRRSAPRRCGPRRR
ncbi:MAG: EamA family transporter [Oscillospiraceae bacterium]|nr:EamA family transporter [Oscillospiraceae bacterium]